MDSLALELVEFDVDFNIGCKQPWVKPVQH